MAQLAPIRLSASGRVIGNFALQHFQAAKTLRGHVERLELKHHGQPFGPFFEDIRSYCSACIMSSVAAMESLINELYIAHGSALRTVLPDFETAFWGNGKRKGIERKSILAKYEYALTLLKSAPLDQASDSYLDADALIACRNALVHFKPTWDSKRRKLIDLENYLATRFRPSPFPDDGADFVTMKCMSTGCACWAVNTCRKFIRDFAESYNCDHKKLSAFS